MQRPRGQGRAEPVQDSLQRPHTRTERGRERGQLSATHEPGQVSGEAELMD